MLHMVQVWVRWFTQGHFYNYCIGHGDVPVPHWSGRFSTFHTCHEFAHGRWNFPLYRSYRGWRRDSLSFPALWSLVLPPAFTLQGYATKYVVKVLSVSVGPLFSLYCIIWSTYYCAYGLGTCLGYLEQARSLSICAPWQWMFFTSSNNTCTRSL